MSATKQFGAATGEAIKIVRLDRIEYLFGPVVDVNSEVLRKGGGKEEEKEGSYPLVEDYVSMNGRIGQCDWE